MKLPSGFALILLAGCSGSGSTNAADIANAANAIETKAEADLNAAISEIESESGPPTDTDAADKAEKR